MDGFNVATIFSTLTTNIQVLVVNFGSVFTIQLFSRHDFSIDIEFDLLSCEHPTYMIQFSLRGAYTVVVRDKRFCICWVIVL